MRQPYDQLTEHQKVLICNGCGFCFFDKNHCILEKLIPDFDWTEVCNEHDYYSKVGGFLTEYLGTQVVFYGKIVMKIADSSNKITTRLYKSLIALVYFAFVFVFGVFGFHWGRPRSIRMILSMIK